MTAPTPAAPLPAPVAGPAAARPRPSPRSSARRTRRVVRHRRRRTLRTLGITFVVVGSLAAFALTGAFGAFITTVQRTGTAKAGVVSLSDNASSTFTTPFANLLPGDAGDRYFELVNEGDVDFTVTALVDANATTNPNNASNADIDGSLVITAYYCSGTYSWNGGSPTCTDGDWTTFDDTAGTGFNANTVSNLSSLQAFKVNGGTSNQLDAGTTHGVKISVEVPSSAPATLQGAEVTLTWTFAATQLAARDDL